MTPSVSSFNTGGGEAFDDDMGTPPNTPPPARRVGRNGKPIRRPRANTCIGQVQPGGLSDTTGRKNRTTPPKAGAHLVQLPRADSTTAKPKANVGRTRPKSTTPETEASQAKKEEESLQSQPLKKKGLSPSTARFIEASKRLFARLMGGDKSAALTTDLDGDAALAEAERVASRFSLPARMEDVEDRAPLIPVDDEPAAPKFRFPCVECHAPESARWNFPTQSPTKCADCKALEAPAAAAATPAPSDGGGGAASASAGAGAAVLTSTSSHDQGQERIQAAKEQEQREVESVVAVVDEEKKKIPKIAVKAVEAATEKLAATTMAITNKDLRDVLDAASAVGKSSGETGADAVRDEETPEKSGAYVREVKVFKPSAIAANWEAAKALATAKELRRKASPPKMANLDDAVAQPRPPVQPVEPSA